MQERDRRKKERLYDAPVYRVKKRTGLNFITTLSLHTQEDRSKWILRGVALLCTTD